MVLAIQWACATAPQQDADYEGSAQDSLAGAIRSIRAGEEVAGLAEAVAAAARIAPEDLDDDLRDAMTHALALSIEVEDSVLRQLGSTLEDALATAWPQEELTATIREIPLETGRPTARQTVAARLVARLEAGEAGDDLRAAIAEAFTSISRSHYLMHGIRDELAVAWARHHSAEELAGFIRSILTGAEQPEQAAAAHVLVAGPYWQEPPSGMDSTGVTDPDLRRAVVEALAHLNESQNRRERERNRLEAIGDRAGLDSLRAEERRQSRPSGNLQQTLAEIVWWMRDPATIGLLAEARGVGVALDFFGQAAVSPILTALTDPHAYRDQIAGLLTDLAAIAKERLPVESRDAVTAATQGFLSGETLRAMQIIDPRGNVLGVAIDLAVALDDPALLDMARSLAADPAEIVRAGIASRNANEVLWNVRRNIGWMPAPRSQAEIAAELRTVLRSTRVSLTQQEAAMLAAQIDPDLLSDTLRSAMIEAWDHAGRATDDSDWYRMRSALTGGLRAGYTSARALAAIRAIPAGEYGPEQSLAVSFAQRFEDFDEDLRLAMIAALEHANGALADDRAARPRFSLQRSLVYAVGRLEDPRGIPPLARSGWGFTCNTHMRGYAVDIAREVVVAITEPGAPLRWIDAGLDDLAILQVGDNHTGEFPDDLVETVVATARGYLDGGALEPFATAAPAQRQRIVNSAILLAAATDDPELVALAEALAADPEAVAALGFTDPNRIERIRVYARDRLAERPILGLGDC